MKSYHVRGYQSEFETLARHVADSWDSCGEHHAQMVARGFAWNFPSTCTEEELMRHARRIR